jgi:hypothetical protein
MVDIDKMRIAAVRALERLLALVPDSSHLSGKHFLPASDG